MCIDDDDDDDDSDTLIVQLLKVITMTETRMMRKKIIKMKTMRPMLLTMLKLMVITRTMVMFTKQQ